RAIALFEHTRCHATALESDDHPISFEQIIEERFNGLLILLIGVDFVTRTMSVKPSEQADRSFVEVVTLPRALPVRANDARGPTVAAQMVFDLGCDTARRRERGR